MAKRIANDRRAWRLGVGIAYCAIILATEHTGLFPGLAVPLLWAEMAFSSDPLDSGLTPLSLLAAVAVVAAFLSRLFDAAYRRSGVFEALSIVCLAASAFIVCRISDALPLSLMSIMPFAVAVFGDVLFSLSDGSRRSGPRAEEL